MTIEQAETPEQLPLQPANVELGSGEAVRVTGVPPAKFAEQVLPQSIPAGLLLTLPDPLPARDTERVNPCCVPTPPSITVTLLLPALATYILFVSEFTATAIGPSALESVTVVTVLVAPSITLMLLLPQFATYTKFLVGSAARSLVLNGAQAVPAFGSVM
jgi:hypothetical protein